MAQLQDNSAGGANARVTAGRLWTGLYDANGNPIAKTNATNAASTDTGLPLSFLHSQEWQLARGDTYGGLALAQSQILISDEFATITTPNPAKWNYAASGLAAAGTIPIGMNFTSTTATTANAYSGSISRRWLVKKLRVPLVVKCRAQFNSVANSACEFGFGNPSTNAALANGAMWTRDITGSVYPAIVYNGGTPIVGTNVTGLTASQYYHWEIIWDDDQFIFTLMDSSTGFVINQQILRLPITQPKFYANDHAYVYARAYNSGTAPVTAPVMIVPEIIAAQLDVNTAYTAAEIAASNNWGSEQNPILGTPTPNWTNSTAALAATLSNTAAGYATPGGKFDFAAVAGAATDYALFAYQAPYNLFVKGVYIDTFNNGAAVATTSTQLQWMIGQATALSLATANGLRRMLGQQTFAIGAAIGAQATPVNRQWATPFFVPAGNYLQIILTMPVGTATASQVINGLVDIDGWYE